MCVLLIKCLMYFNSITSGVFRGFCAKTTGLHEHNSGAKSSRKLFKGSKDSASLLACTRKNFFAWGVADFL